MFGVSWQAGPCLPLWQLLGGNPATIVTQGFRQNENIKQNYIMLWSGIHWKDHYEILHMSRQQSCRDMC